MNRQIKTFGFLAALGGIVALIFLLLEPSEAGAAVFLGLSVQRLTLVFVLLIFVLALLALALRASKVEGWVVGHFNQLEILFGILFVTGWLAAWMPAYRLGALSGYFERLYPLLIWTLWLSAVALTLRYADKGVRWAELKEPLRSQPALWRAALIALGIFLLLWVWIAFSGTGLKRDIDMWNEGGVPVLGLQVLFALGLAGSVLFWEHCLNGEKAHRRFDAGLFILLWLVAAFVWWQQPILRSYFLPRPVPPNFEFYPFSDAALYDFGGQQVLLGNGINNGIFTDKPMYMFLLAIFHALGGQSYNGVILVQVLFVAFYPAVLYLIGKNLDSRPAGLMLAILAIFKEKNAIAAALDIQVTHSKLMMTEMPTALAVSVVVLIGLIWFRHSKDKLTLPLWGGASLGFAALIRPTPILAAPFIVLLAFPLYGRLRKQWFVASAIFGLGILLLMGPWFGFSQAETGENYLLQKIQQVLKRFKLTLSSGQSLRDESVPDYVLVSKPDLMLVPPGAMLPRTVSQDENPNMAQLIPAHFWHNEITSLVIFPMTFQYYDLDHTVAQPPWQLDWEGAASPENIFFVFLSLSVLALGIGVAWHRVRWAGLLPLVVHVAYNFASAFARTSGSRYIVPVDWVLILYYALGMIQLLTWTATLLGKQPVTGESVSLASPTHARKSLLFPASVTIVLLVGLSLPFNNLVIPQKFESYSAKNVADSLGSVHVTNALKEQGINLPRVITLAEKDKREMLIHGRAFFPRFYDAQQGDCTLCFMMDDAYITKNYSRLAFTIVGPKNGAVTLTLDAPPTEFSNATEVFVYGCRTANRNKYNMIVMDAKFVVVVSKTGPVVYTSSDFSGKLVCSGN